MDTSIHQEVFLNASPQKVYQAFMDEKLHSALTGASSVISTKPGGLAIMHDEQITARNIELEEGRKIVQAWRVAGWDDGIYTILRIMLAPKNGGTTVILDQTGCPKEMTEHLAAGWQHRYWAPLKAHFKN